MPSTSAPSGSLHASTRFRAPTYVRNVIERASIICPGEWVELAHLGMSAPTTNSAPRVGADLSLEELEKAHIAAVLANSETLDQAARTLGIDASTLYRKRKQYNL